MSLKTDLHAFRSGPGAKLVSDLARDGGLSI
jgi:hypothetical protein